jgi:hypothetical protein
MERFSLMGLRAKRGAMQHFASSALQIKNGGNPL